MDVAAADSANYFPAAAAFAAASALLLSLF